MGVLTAYFSSGINCGAILVSSRLAESPTKSATSQNRTAMEVSHHIAMDSSCIIIVISRSIASSINLEFRDVNKFISELGGSTVVVTDSWIIQCNLRTMDIVHQRDAVLK